VEETGEKVYDSINQYSKNNCRFKISFYIDNILTADKLDFICIKDTLKKK